MEDHQVSSNGNRKRKKTHFFQNPGVRTIHRQLLKLGLLVVLISYLYTLHTNRRSADVYTVEQIVLDSWNRLLKKPAVEFKKVLVGINSNVDLIVSGRRVMQALNVSRRPMAKDHDAIKTMRDLEEVYSYFFVRGTPGERPFENANLFQKVVAESEMEAKGATFAVGGNAAIMAQQIARSYTKARVSLVGPIGPRLKALLHPGVITEESPKITRDEVHLIMEFKQGEIFGDHIAAASNAFITSRDTLSRSSITIEMLFKTVKTFKPDLIILSGLHLLSGLHEHMFNEKLTHLRRNIVQLEKAIPTHLQIGNMAYNQKYANYLLHRVLPYVDSIGINEEILTLLVAAGGGPHPETYPPKVALVHPHLVSDMLSWLLHNFGHDPTHRDSKRFHYRLQRIHFYCLTYHMIATRGREWTNNEAALAAGARHAGTSACGQTSRTVSSESVELRIGDSFLLDTSEANITYAFSPHTPLVSWTRDNNVVQLSYTPILVCKEPAQTVGLGDQIASSALLYSRFYRFEDLD